MKAKFKANQERFMAELKSHKMSNVAFADYLGVSERTIYRWKRGESRVPMSVFKYLHIKDNAQG